MSECFGAVALRLAGLVPRSFGWRPDDFWKATPAELAAILSPASGEEECPLSRTELNTLLEREQDG
ncbi:phage tail assembly chaperone [Altericroceibacterium xinjiangense]|uniref:phage tail assembly chaperone n=1 Tax=Altericroceibacterium xinjiangense TaxID=762261 RepID=UPI000F7E60DC|nr:phage tail assembly chaperone [Altericroceibacterium xinjiangense]